MGNNQESTRAGVAGILASLFTWFVGVFQWYASHLTQITAWIVHIAQLGGLVVLYFSILILRRNWKSGRNSIDPKQPLQ